MTEKKTIAIPELLTNTFFFGPNETLAIDVDSLQNFQAKIPFLYEAAYFSGIEAIKPWEYPEDYVPLVMKEWQSEKLLLEELFVRRDRKQTAEPMKKGISLFWELVYWTNGFPVELSKGFTRDILNIHPVNLEERLKFIIERPTLYHSFVQLKELISEMEKQSVKQIALKKASKQ